LTVRYPDALGTRIDVKIVQDNYKFQKIVEIESLAALGKIPDSAKFLEISFRISGDFTIPEGDITGRIPFGENSFISPVKAWDKSETTENLEAEIQSGTTGSISKNIITKKIPVAWLKQATFPMMTDATITYGAENFFNSAYSNYTSVAALDSTHFVVAYTDIGNSNYGTCRVGEVSATVTGWSGKINGITDPAKINTVAVENIAKVNGVE